MLTVSFSMSCWKIFGHKQMRLCMQSSNYSLRSRLILESFYLCLRSMHTDSCIMSYWNESNFNYMLLWV